MEARKNEKNEARGMLMGNSVMDIIFFVSYSWQAGIQWFFFLFFIF